MAINHHRQGAGLPLVLIHGIGLRWQIFRPVIGRLAADFEVIACDSPGFGQLDCRWRYGVSPTIPAYAEAFERFFAAEGLGRPHVAGNSMGGAIALELARRGAVATATAISPAVVFLDAGAAALLPGVAPLAGADAAGRAAGAGGSDRNACRAHGAAVADVRLPHAATGGRGRRDAARWLCAAPAFASALAAFDDYAFAAGEQLWLGSRGRRFCGAGRTACCRIACRPRAHAHCCRRPGT